MSKKDDLFKKLKEDNSDEVASKEDIMNILSKTNKQIFEMKRKKNEEQNKEIDNTALFAAALENIKKDTDIKIISDVGDVNSISDIKNNADIEFIHDNSKSFDKEDSSNNDFNNNTDIKIISDIETISAQPNNTDIKNISDIKIISPEKQEEIIENSSDIKIISDINFSDIKNISDINSISVHKENTDINFIADINSISGNKEQSDINSISDINFSDIKNISDIKIISLYIVSQIDNQLLKLIYENKITATEFLILTYFNKNAYTSDKYGYRQIAKAINLSDMTVKNALDNLDKKGIIERIKSYDNRASHYYLNKILEEIYNGDPNLKKDFIFNEIVNTIYSIDVSKTPLLCSMLYNNINNNIILTTNRETEETDETTKNMRSDNFNFFADALTYFEIRANSFNKIQKSYLHNLSTKFRDSQRFGLSSLKTNFELLTEYYLKQENIKSIGGFLVKGFNENWGDQNASKEERDLVEKINKKIDTLKDKNKIDDLSREKIEELIRFFNIKIDTSKNSAELREELKKYYENTKNAIIETLKNFDIIQEGEK